MSNEAYSFALKQTLSEIQSICPDIRNSFVFRRDGQIVAGDKKTSSKILSRVTDSFSDLSEKAHAIGGVEGITVEGDDGRLDIFSMNGLHLVMVTSRKADKKYVDTVTRVLIPTILRLLEKIHPSPLKSITPPMETEILTREVEESLETPEFKESLEKPEVEEPFETPEVEEPFETPEVEEPFETPEVEEPFETPTEESSSDETSSLKTLAPGGSLNQFIVENLGGLLVPSDTVRVEDELLSRWRQLSKGTKIEEVEVVTFNGKAARCKVKPIKDSKYKGKGVIRVPEKIQINLDIKKGELVRVKPVFN